MHDHKVVTSWYTTPLISLLVFPPPLIYSGVNTDTRASRDSPPGCSWKRNNGSGGPHTWLHTMSRRAPRSHVLPGNISPSNSHYVIRNSSTALNISRLNTASLSDFQRHSLTNFALAYRSRVRLKKAERENFEEKH